jgi:hypothetical protein
MSSILGGPKTPTTPAVAVAPPMPDQQSPQVTEAATNAGITATQRAGRQSTILGKQGPPTGADSFSATKLGSNS